MARRRRSFCSGGAVSFLFWDFLAFCFSRTSLTRSIRGQSWQGGTVAAAAGARGVCESGTKASSCFVRSEWLCSATESTRVLCLARSIEGGAFFRRSYGDCSARGSRSEDLGRDTRPEIFEASRGADKLGTFAGGDDLIVNLSRGGSDKLLGEKCCVLGPVFPMIKFLMGTNAWSTRFDTT